MRVTNTMKKTATVIIGANFGDEGKGNLTNYFARPDSLVCRFSGGGQAGHTVVHDGKRHVFRHFGSGTMQGAATLLSRFYINNPILYFQERKLLYELGFDPTVYVDPAGLVTTPVDMMINQIIEETRGDARHGSCGVGINETIKRHAHYPLVVADLSNKAALDSRLREIMANWVPERLQQLGVEPSDEWLARLESPAIRTTFADYCADYVAAVQLSSDALAHASHIVFEGAQGLLLDEDHYWFPHVTHAHTGLHNVSLLATEMGIDELFAVYVSRVYATRHGAGPFPREVLGMQFEDDTNLPNPWQGALRFGELDLDLLTESIVADMSRSTLPVRCGLAMTCLDQVGEEVGFHHHGVRHVASASDLVLRASDAVRAENLWLGFGPDRIAPHQLMPVG